MAAAAAIGVLLAWHPGPVESVVDEVRGAATSVEDYIQRAEQYAAEGHQAGAVHSLVVAVQHDQASARQAVAAIRLCRHIGAETASLQVATRSTRSHISQARGLHVDQLPHGVELQQRLVAALQSSLQSEQAYARWATTRQRRSCSSATVNTKDVRMAAQRAAEAGKQYRLVTVLWKPIAHKHGWNTALIW